MTDTVVQDPDVAALARQVADLAAREAIRTCLYRINRGLDRIDADLLASGFHPDATVRWGRPEPLPVGEWLSSALAMQGRTQRAQHLLGNILIDLNGDRAHVESYEIGRHLTPMGETMKDLIIAARYLDTFERRDGHWRIARRDKVPDWSRIMEGADGHYDRAPVTGRRDGQDLSFERFGADAFHSLI